MIKRLYLELTNRCNLNCPFCSGSNRDIVELPLELIEKVFIDSKTITEYIYLHVKGEPLLYSYFNEALLLASTHQRKIQLVTNGTLLKQYLQLLVNSSAIHKISISLQGLFLSDNLNEHLATIDQLIDKRGSKIIELRVWAVQDPHIEEYLSKYKTYINNSNIYVSRSAYFNWPTLDNSFYRLNRTCVGPKTMLCILSNGVITPCCLDQDGIIALGNIADTNLVAVLDSLAYKQLITGFQNNIAVNQLCRHCSYKGGIIREVN